MTVNRTTLLDLPLPVTGTESGTWGDTTNNGLTQYMDIAIAGMSNLTSSNFTAGALTIETTEGTSAGTNITATSAQYAGFRVSSLATNSTITVGNTGTSPARSYRLINADATYNLTFKATGQTGITLPPGCTAVVAFNGTDYEIVGTIGPIVPIANGGTGGTTQATARTGIGASTVGSNFFTLTNPSAITFPRINADNTVSALDAATFRTAIGAGTGGGSVTSVSGTGTVNGITLSGTVTSSGSLTLGGALSGVSLTSQVSGTLPVANGGTNATATPTAGGVSYGTGSAYAFTSAGTSGQVLTSNGSGAPTWQTLPSGGVSSLTASTGISVSASTGAVTVTNTGVTSLSASTGISVSASTGSSTITNTGVTSLSASTGISVSASTGASTITNTGVTSLTAGTGISLSGSTGGVTVSATDNGVSRVYNASYSSVVLVDITGLTNVSALQLIVNATSTGLSFWSNFGVQLYINGSLDTSNNYFFSQWVANGSATNNITTSNTTRWALGSGSPLNTPDTAIAWINGVDGTVKRMFLNGPDLQRICKGHFAKTAGSITGLRIITGNGSDTSSGTISLWAYQV